MTRARNLAALLTPILVVQSDGNGEGGQIDLRSADNSQVLYSFDIDNGDNARIFTTKNGQSLTIGQLVGSGAVIKFFIGGTERARFDDSGLHQYTPIKFDAAYSNGAQMDVSNPALTMAAGGQLDYPNFSGLMVINDHTTGGQIGAFTCGGAVVTSLGAVMISLTVTYVAGINGYRITNSSAGSITIGVAAIRTRTIA